MTKLLEDLDTAGYYALGIPVIVLVFLLELRAHRRGKRILGFAETISNLSAGLGTLVIGLFTGPLVFALYDRVHAHWGLVDWNGSLLRWPVGLLLVDLCYYLWHRAGHRFGLLWTIHGVHHQHEHLNSTVGMRLEWLADLPTLFFFAPLPLLIDPATGFVAIAAVSLYALGTHSPVFAHPAFWILVTPASHGSHHSRDARFRGKNFGAMFTIWDRLLGTYREPVLDLDELRPDLPTVCRYHDGVRSQWSLVVELARRLRRAGSRSAVGQLLFGPPVLETAPAPRDDREISPSLRAFIVFDFLVIAALGTWILWQRDLHPRSIQVLGALATLWGLRSIGGLLDGRRGAVREEVVRLLVLLGLALASQDFRTAAPIAGASVVTLFGLCVARNVLEPGVRVES